MADVGEEQSFGVGTGGLPGSEPKLALTAVHARVVASVDEERGASGAAGRISISA
jgi:hypothetical protein